MLSKTVLSCRALSCKMVQHSFCPPPTHTPPTHAHTQKYSCTFQMPSRGMTLRATRLTTGPVLIKSPKEKLYVLTPSWDCCGSGKYLCRPSPTILREREFLSVENRNSPTSSVTHELVLKTATHQQEFLSVENCNSPAHTSSSYRCLTGMACVTRAPWPRSRKLSSPVASTKGRC